MAAHPSVPAMWRDYLATPGRPDAAAGAGYSAWYFGDNEQDADELATLVLAGRKRATASALWSYELQGERLPAAGDVSIVTDYGGTAICVIRTTRVDIVPFNEVTAEFAAAEGEGDSSLAYWRRGHWDCFARELAPHGREPAETMPVVCEYFEVVYAPTA